MTKNDKV